MNITHKKHSFKKIYDFEDNKELSMTVARNLENIIFNDFQLEIFLFGQIIYGKNDNAKNYEALNKLQLILDGKGKVKCNGIVYDLKPGYGYIFPTNSQVELYDNENLVKYYSKFKAIYKKRDIFINTKPIVFLIDKNILNNSKLLIDTGNILIAKSIFYNIFYKIHGPISKIINRRKFIFNKYDKFFDYINENIHKNLSVKELSLIFNKNEKYFSEEFKKYFGKSPKQYYLEEKINKAKELLLYSNNSVKIISDDMGFADQYYFSKLFKKYVGISPKKFKIKYMNSIE